MASVLSVTSLRPSPVVAARASGSGTRARARAAGAPRAACSHSTRGAALGAKARNKLRAAAPCSALGLRRPRVVACSAAKSVEEINAEFSIPGSVTAEVGDGGLTKVKLTHQKGSSAEVYLFGACVTSYTQSHGSEVLYVRPDAKFDGVKPISGGVPHCFPQFGPSNKMQQHGFARNCTWEVIGSSADVNPDYPEPAVLLQLTDNEYTRSMWDYGFKFVYEVTLRQDRLKVEMRVQNADAKEFEFTTALHSYIGVLDAANPAVNVKGLTGKTFLDKVPDPNNPVPTVDEKPMITFGTGLVDSVYLDTDPETVLEVGTGCAVAVENTRGFSDTVVWNPHETLQPSCWKDFVCVESARVSKPVVLGPGDEWIGELNISTFDL